MWVKLGIEPNVSVLKLIWSSIIILRKSLVEVIHVKILIHSPNLNLTSALLCTPAPSAF